MLHLRHTDLRHAVDIQGLLAAVAALPRLARCELDVTGNPEPTLGWCVATLRTVAPPLRRLAPFPVPRLHADCYGAVPAHDDELAAALLGRADACLTPADDPLLRLTVAEGPRRHLPRD